MELLVIPPFTDFTTEIVPPPGAEVLDLGAGLVERLTDPARLRDGPHAALTGRAAAVIERAAYDDAHLRAVGAALRLAGDPALRLTLDGLELAEGSTQSSRDVLAAAARCELFGPRSTRPWRRPRSGAYMSWWTASGSFPPRSRWCGRWGRNG